MDQRSTPDGTVYDWFQRASELLARGDAAASVTLVDHVLHEEPDSPAALELRARALFDSAQYAEAATAFARCLEISPDDDYAHYGAGMSLWRLQEFPEARDHLAMASVMRPDRAAYSQALTQVRATITARRKAGMPLTGPVHQPPVLGIDTMVADYPDGDSRLRPVSDYWSPLHDSDREGGP